MQNKPSLLYLFLLLVFCSCARNFIKPDLTDISYTPKGSTTDKLDFDISQEPIEFTEHFAKKLEKREIDIHVLRVKNVTPDTVWLKTPEIQLFNSQGGLEVIPPRRVYKAMRQPVAVHALWLLVGPFIRTDNDGVRQLDYYPLGAAFAAWGIGNGIVAYRANRELKEMLQITLPAGDTPVAPGTTRYMLLPLPKDAGKNGIQLQYSQEVTPLPAPAPNSKGN